MSDDPKPLLGRCDFCDYALFATREQVKDVDGWKGVARAGMPYRVSNYGLFARCPSNHKVFRLKEIKGTYSEAHKCDARCLNAKGHECTCSCGGMNHGRGHAVTIQAAAPVERHIGEVGKNIVGYVTVTGIVEHDTYTIYVFATDSGDTIKTFTSNLAVKQGDRYKIRAKVKRHDDHERFGKSTIVETPTILDEQLTLND